MGFLKEHYVPFLGIKITYANDKNALSTWSNGVQNLNSSEFFSF